MKRADAKRDLLKVLAVILSKDDDLFPDDLELDVESKPYQKWDAARNDLVEEFERRAASPVKGTT